MTEMPEQYHSRDQLNREDSEAMLLIGETIRKLLITAVYKAIAMNRVEDAKQMDRIGRGEIGEGEELDFFVKEDLLAAPFEGNVPTRTLSLRLERDKDLGQEGDDSMVVYLPIPDDFEPLEDFDEQDLPLPDKVYLARFVPLIDGTDGTILRAAVEKDRYYTYTSAADTGADDIFGYDDPAMFFTRMTLRVKSDVPDVSQFYEDLINMRSVPQFHYPPRTDEEAA